MSMSQPRPMPRQMPVSAESSSELRPEQLMTDAGQRFIKRVILKTLGKYSVKWDNQQVDDVAQDAWVKAYRKLSKFGTGNFEAWMTTLVSRTVIDELRKSSAREKKGSLVRDEDHERVLENRSAGGGGQEDWEARMTIEARINRLSNEEREVVELAHSKRLTSEQIAERLGRTVRRVQALLRSARKKIIQGGGEEEQEAA